MINLLYALFKPSEIILISKQFNHHSKLLCCLSMIVMPLIPVVSWYIGLTEIGWVIGVSDKVKLSKASGVMLAQSMYIAMIILMLVVGLSIRWMSITYGKTISTEQGLLFSGYVSTPFFILGICGLYPLLWLDIIVLIGAIVWSLVLLYKSMPVVMNISSERAFLFSSAATVSGAIGFTLIVGVVMTFMALGHELTFID